MRRTNGSVKSLGRAALLAGAVLVAGGAQAQPADPAAAEPVRFTVQTVEGGLMRLDTQTGALSFCTQRAGGWACEAVPDDRAALEAEISRLQARLAALEKNRASGGAGVPDIMAPPQTTPPDATPPDAARPDAARPDASPPAAAPSPGADGELPAQARQRLDQAMDLAEHAFRRFVEMVERLRKDLPPDGPPAPLPPKGEPF
ncbi:hypothetical protein [Ancylobacter vacuolatus]|uniref:Uncharacterized protein n=1 Tax=Ancylobacter vacuolatus TaxID=223389 RepID=A0ABU0DLZ1_9HYPH|nr:hypothetical protein [Ancylobacter vacuolatus]MDQ0349459.1 hypothetical protein [Ancylobacter vacuolatus]